MQIPKFKLSWLACAIDSEGCISLTRAYELKNKRGFTFAAVVNIANKNEKYINYAKNISGGRVNYGKSRRCYILVYRKPEILFILPKLLPYLIIKRKQAQLLLQYFSFHTQGKHGLDDMHLKQRSAISDKISSLSGSKGKKHKVAIKSSKEIIEKKNISVTK